MFLIHEWSTYLNVRHCQIGFKLTVCVTKKQKMKPNKFKAFKRNEIKDKSINN